MPLLRRIPTRRLVLLCVALAVIAAGGAALALAASSGGPVPPRKPLARAVHDAIAAPDPQGVTARIKFTNNLLNGADVRGANPLIAGATGRLWAADDGRFRLELQGNGGDAQVVSDGRTWWVYDGTSNRVWRGTVPVRERRAHARRERVPSIARIQRILGRVMRHAAIAGPTPTDVAGRPAYQVRVSPLRHGGLLGAIELAWDAERGNPLRGAVYARGASDPVLELEATEISYGPVPADAFAVSPPSGAETHTLTPDGRARHRRHAVTGVRRVRSRLPFALDAPVRLGGQRRHQVALAPRGRAAIIGYGRGLDGILVIERKATPAGARGDDPLASVQLPTVSIGGVDAQELETPLGTLIRFERGGVRYTVVGSVPRATAEAAARGL